MSDEAQTTADETEPPLGEGAPEPPLGGEGEEGAGGPTIEGAHNRDVLVAVAESFRNQSGEIEGADEG